MTLTRKFWDLSQKSLSIVLTLGLLGGAAAAQLGAKPSAGHAMMAPTTPPAASALVDINSASKADLSCRELATSTRRRSLTAGRTRQKQIWSTARLFRQQLTPKFAR